MCNLGANNNRGPNKTKSAAERILISLAILVLTSTKVTAQTTCTNPEPTCSTPYYKISDESNGLATSCAAVDQTADPVVGLDQAGCQAACDEMEGCDTINFRWKDPNFGGESTCYRKNCGDFVTASCTLFSKHKERDVYTKACGVKELWEGHVIGDVFTDLYAGVSCPDETSEDVAQVLAACSAGDVADVVEDEVSKIISIANYIILCV